MRCLADTLPFIHDSLGSGRPENVQYPKQKIKVGNIKIYNIIIKINQS